MSQGDLSGRAEDDAEFELVKEGLRRDGVEIEIYQPAQKPGSKAESRVERVIALCFTVAGLLSFGFIAVYAFWPWKYKSGWNINKWYTPMLGLTLGGALFLIGIGILTWGKKLLPREVSVQDRHDGPSPKDERELTGAALVNAGRETGVARRPLLKRSLGFGLAPLGLAAIVPLGALIKSPGHKLHHTAWRKGVRLVLSDGNPVRPEDVSVGGQITVFPGVPGGTKNHHADSSALLIHLREADAVEARGKALDINKGSEWENFVAYSKICTHAGCPASLYEQQTNILLCPCHQSQFKITDNARPVFGPATRRLPMLPITVDEEGFFIATADYKVPVGPGFWERP